MKETLSRISESELEVMGVLWEAGDALPLTEIREKLQVRTGWESSTIKTLVQRLHAKGAIRQEKRGVYYYSPLVSEDEYGRYAARSLINRLYHGRAGALVAALVDSELSGEELDELRGLLSGEEPNGRRD